MANYQDFVHNPVSEPKLIYVSRSKKIQGDSVSYLAFCAQVLVYDIVPCFSNMSLQDTVDHVSFSF